MKFRFLDKSDYRIIGILLKALFYKIFLRARIYIEENSIPGCSTSVGIIKTKYHKINNEFSFIIKLN